MNTRQQVSTRRPHHRCTGYLLNALQRTQHKLERVARLTLGNPNRRKVLKLLVCSPQGLRYQTLFDALDVGERWIRSLIADLRNAGIVVTPGNPANIQFSTEEIELAVRELVRFLDADWVASITTNEPRECNLSPIPQASHEDAEEYLKIIAEILRGKPG